MVSVVVFEFSVMRCQPLRRALCLISQNQSVVAFSLFLRPFVRVCRQLNNAVAVSCKLML